MENSVLRPAAISRIRDIHQLSIQYNQQKNKDHNTQLLAMVKEHAEEIAVLYEKNDPHYLTETGDLAVLCFELILEGQGSLDDVLTRCFSRFEKKLTGLLKGS
jgi:hypothetical protein